MDEPTTAGSDHRHLRVGTAQREHALEVLRNAAADGRLTFEELESRVPRALGAVTRGDIADVLGDLVPAEQLDQSIAESLVGEGPGYSWDEPLVLIGSTWHLLSVEGPWEVPPFLEVHASYGGCRLDFSQATTRTRVIDLVLIGYLGAVTIIVPEGWGVDTTTYQSERTTTEQKGVLTRPRKGLPRIILRGQASGSVKVRLPTDADRRRVIKRQAKGKPLLPPELSLTRALPPGPSA
ncbi:DUF1707 SHOCT-like domain-containing protein [Aestuariimicrobium soli]|uniref:DUF1707 SHOCT-like domain-containing protein n=1 Tax=Aestuariimicrobium soli TaxID=2035834 RepID=UPI003EBDD7AA